MQMRSKIWNIHGILLDNLKNHRDRKTFKIQKTVHQKGKQNFENKNFTNVLSMKQAAA